MIEVKIDDAEISRALANLATFLGDMTKTMGDIGEGLVASTNDRFGLGIAPDGSRWAKNSPVTLAFKRDTRPLFGETGSLSKQTATAYGKDFVEVFNPMIYAAMMQFGGKKSEFPHLWGDIPARPFLGVSEQDEKDILDTISEALSDLAGG